MKCIKTRKEMSTKSHPLDTTRYESESTLLFAFSSETRSCCSITDLNSNSYRVTFVPHGLTTRINKYSNWVERKSKSVNFHWTQLNLFLYSTRAVQRVLLARSAISLYFQLYLTHTTVLMTISCALYLSSKNGQWCYFFPSCSSCRHKIAINLISGASGVRTVPPSTFRQQVTSATL